MLSAAPPTQILSVFKSNHPRLQTALATQEGIYSFGSGAKEPNHKLSNFYLAPIKLTRDNVTPAMKQVCPSLEEFLKQGGMAFHSSEHLWQSLKALNYQTFREFGVAGVLSQWNRVSFARFYPKPGVAATKFDYWNKKQNRGILAKLAANPKHAARAFGWQQGVDMNFEREHLEAGLEKQVWVDILQMKFEQNPPLKEILLATGSRPLMEMARNPVDHWGGMISAETGAIIGCNFMGQYMEAVRDLLRR